MVLLPVKESLVPWKNLTVKGSSVYLEDDSKWGPQLATDGKLSTSSTGYFHTFEERNPWLDVNFGGCKAVTLVRIKHRIDCCVERFKNAQLSLYIENDSERTTTGKFKLDGPTQANQPSDFDFPTPVISNGLVLQLEGIAVLQVLKNTTLYLCFVGICHLNLGK